MNRVVLIFCILISTNHNYLTECTENRTTKHNVQATNIKPQETRNLLGTYASPIDSYATPLVNIHPSVHHNPYTTYAAAPGPIHAVNRVVYDSTVEPIIPQSSLIVPVTTELVVPRVSDTGTSLEYLEKLYELAKLASVSGLLDTAGLHHHGLHARSGSRLGRYGLGAVKLNKHGIKLRNNNLPLAQEHIPLVESVPVVHNRAYERVVEIPASPIVKPLGASFTHPYSEIVYEAPHATRLGHYEKETAIPHIPSTASLMSAAESLNGHHPIETANHISANLPNHLSSYGPVIAAVKSYRDHLLRHEGLHSRSALPLPIEDPILQEANEYIGAAATVAQAAAATAEAAASLVEATANEYQLGSPMNTGVNNCINVGVGPIGTRHTYTTDENYL